MFVPSLSWQTVAFVFGINKSNHKRKPLKRFFSPASAQRGPTLPCVGALQIRP
jgi:hypothetical protein